MSFTAPMPETNDRYEEKRRAAHSIIDKAEGFLAITQPSENWRDDELNLVVHGLDSRDLACLIVQLSQEAPEAFQMAIALLHETLNADATNG